MGFYDLPKAERDALVANMNERLLDDLRSGGDDYPLEYFADEDTYIRKTAYVAIGRIYYAHPRLNDHIIHVLQTLLANSEPRVRQTVVNAAGEIGKTDFVIVQQFFDTGLFDDHHSVRNAVIGLRLTGPCSAIATGAGFATAGCAVSSPWMYARKSSTAIRPP